MQTIYLDQNHWIGLSRVAHGWGCSADVGHLLQVLRTVKAERRARFPLSLSHYMETWKHAVPERRERLAQFMLELSGGETVASFRVVVQHELESALERLFPGRIQPRPFEFVRHGLSHAAGQNFDVHLEWPFEALTVSPEQRARFEKTLMNEVSLNLLSGVLREGDILRQRPPTDLSADRRFETALGDWRGIAARCSRADLDRRIYATTLADIDTALFAALVDHGIRLEEFALLGEQGWRALLDDMPSRRADMHLRRQWAKNASLTPKESDLNDWAFLGIAVSYCNAVVTEKQVADLFSREFETCATILTDLRELTHVLGSDRSTSDALTPNSAIDPTGLSLTARRETPCAGGSSPRR
ncbi:MAG: hypothetical protein WD688_20240 [Candidatus Binatia bacterium]